MRQVRNSSDFECFLRAFPLSVLCVFARNRLSFAKLKLTHHWKSGDLYARARESYTLASVS